MIALSALLTIGQKVSMVLVDDVAHYPPVEASERYASILDTVVQQVVTTDGQQTLISTLPTWLPDFRYS
jgi:hypothetical protein